MEFTKIAIRFLSKAAMALTVIVSDSD